MRFVDTNIFLRYLTNDLPETASACEELFRRAVEEDEWLFTTEMVVAEIIWVLESYYELPKSNIQGKLEKILNTPNLLCTQKETILEALSLYSEKNIDYIDAYNAVILREQNIEQAYSYDAHYDRIAWIKRMEP